MSDFIVNAIDSFIFAVGITPDKLLWISALCVITLIIVHRIFDGFKWVLRLCVIFMLLELYYYFMR